MDTKISDVKSSFSRIPSYQTNDMKESLRLQNEVINPRNEEPKQVERTPTIADATMRTTLSYVKDKSVDTMVLRIKDEDGEVKMQIPEEVRLRIARQMQEAYSPPAPKLKSIIDDTA